MIVPLVCLTAVVYPRPVAAFASKESLQFEVASVKPSNPGSGMMGVKVHPGARVEISRFELGGLIIVAFGIQPWQLSGGEPWIRDTKYTVEAKPPAAIAARIEDLRYGLFSIEDNSLREMLQALLIDRFHLKFHRETKERDVLLLKQSGDPLKLRPATPLRSEIEDTDNNNAFSSVGRVEGQYSMFATSMPQLARFASGFILRSPVLDRTDLKGSFDYRQKSDLDPTNNGDDYIKSFYDFLKEAGLKLERSKGPVEIFVIDHAETPSPN